MLAVELSNLPDAVQALFVIQLAAERVAGICRLGDQPVGANQLDHLADRARLRVVWVDVEVAGHEREPSIARPMGVPTRGESGAAKPQHTGPIVASK